LNPFDLKDDVKKFIKAVKKWVRDTSVSVGELIQQKFKRFVVRPIRWVYRRLKYYSNLFVEKVAKPLYISISDKIVALSILFKKIFKDLAYLVISLAKLLKKLVSNVYKALASIAKSLSTFYSNSLEFSLRLALSYGNIG
jgi:hypothetical protein